MTGAALPANSERAQADLIKDLQRRLTALETQLRLRSATIDEPGSLQVRDAAGNVLVYAGLQPDGRMGLTVRRNDGTPALELAGFTGDASYHQVLRVFDRTGNEVLGDDETSGQGLATPYIPLPMVKSVDYQATSSSSMTELFEFNFLKQHPKILVGFAAYCDASTAGQVDLYDAQATTVKAGPTAVGTTPTAYLLSSTVSGAHLGLQALRLRARVTSGPGSIHVAGFYAYGVKS